MARILDGREVARYYREALEKVRCSPCLAVVQVGDDPASNAYIRSKRRAFEELGWGFRHAHLPADCMTVNVVDTVQALGADDGVHGVIVQLPLPEGIDKDAVIGAIPLHKDVDGFGCEMYIPCTALGIRQMLKHYSIPIAGKHAVVVGRSDIVGAPTALMLLAEDATVTICHSKTPDLAVHTRQADILVVAVGKPQMITAEMVKPGAVVIDAGINRVDGKLVGDVDYDKVKAVAGWITPVPGGVGPMTVTGLMINTLQACRSAKR